MKRNWMRIGLVFLALPILGFVQGCAELKELRTANSRQAITIRNQMAELEEARRQAEDRDRLRAELEELTNAIGGGAAVRDTIDGPVIQLPGTILFGSGFAVINKRGKSALKKVAEHLRSNPSSLVRIDGHTDADPVKKAKYLWDSNHHLSTGRALSVFNYLVRQENIDARRIHIAGYGPNRPIASNKNKVGKRQNRRVELLILSATDEATIYEEGTGY